jgi:hypothetical protein
MSRGRIVAEVAVVVVAAASLALACRIDAEWCERYFSLIAERVGFVWMWRGILTALALALVLHVRPRLGRWVDRVGAGEALAACARIGLSLVLSVVASEIGLRLLNLPRRYDMAVTEASMGEKNPRTGWLFKASKTFTIKTGDRLIRYDIDADHDRARSIDDLPDPKLPSLLFVGESITAGHALQWDESYPAIVGAEMNLQVVDLGVDGYGSDQAFLRLVDALPRFERPVAIITFFMPGLLERVQRVDHPRLVFDGVEPKLVAPGFLESTRFAQAFRELFSYDAEWAIQTTAEVFRQTVRLANERGARAIFVSPYLGTNWPRGDGYLVDHLLVQPGYAVADQRIGFEPVPGDNHPNAASTRRLAEAVVRKLKAELARN